METGRREKLIKVYYTQGDRFAGMTPGNMLREGQQIAMEHCDDLGYTIPAMLEHHALFMLFKLEMNIVRAPEEGETVRLKTMAYRPERIIYRRIYRFESLEGELLCEVDSRWAMVDTNTRRISREGIPELAALMLPFEKTDDIRQKRVVCDEPADEIKVRHTMIDTNGHVNNAFYADWVTDALEDVLVRGARIKKLRLFYHNQALPGDTVKLMRHVEDGVYYFCGEGSNGRCFDAEAELTEPVSDEPVPLPFYA